jgi:hypothetical protein
MHLTMDSFIQFFRAEPAHYGVRDVWEVTDSS